MIYLDNNATTRIAPEVRAAMLPFLDEAYGNPSSQNALGQHAKAAVLAARQAIATSLGASPAEIIFTSGATEGNHAAITGAVGYFRGQRRQVVASAVEHPSTLKLLQALQQQGIEITLVPVDEHGMLDMAMLDAAISHETALVSVMWANNETGVVFPVEEIAQLAKQRGALFHTDAVQAIGRLPLTWRHSAIDLLSFSGHKLHAPKGIGGLLLRKGLNLPPLFHGSQERNRRGGTENVMAIAGLGAAATLLDSAHPPGLQQLRDRLERHITTALPGARINGGLSPRIANTSNIEFAGINGEALLLQLERAGVIASIGSACQSGGNRPSHVLSAMGMADEAAKSSLRFSLSRYTSADEIELASATILAAASRLAQQPVAQPVLSA
ncbi:MAG: aminotransferase class V-fold PLP-dependent enzyme [Sideroxydans sp.]|nr:aminotransferase class V-fold PLP-dependent enzyme [Sideroxydans sp.]